MSPRATRPRSHVDRPTRVLRHSAGIARALGWLALVCPLACSPPSAPPNVVFILAEDQGAHLGALGTPGLETPSLDALAARGVLFTRAYTPYPVCSAAKASIYTGRWPNVHGLRGNTANVFKPATEITAEERAHPLYERIRIGDAHATLVEVLERAGFETAVTHKLHVLPVEKLPYDRLQRSTAAEDVSTLIARLAEQDAPFFLMLNVKGSHRPFRDSARVAIGVDPTDVVVPAHLPDSPAVRRDWAEYLDSIERTDALVGATLEALEATGLTRRTLVVFTSDHGPAFQRGKQSLHDLGTHVPALVAGPGIESGLRVDALVSHVDWLPTLEALLGLPATDPVDGRSLVPLLEGRPDAAPRAFVYAQVDHEIQQHDHGMRERAVMDGRYRLIWRDDGSKPRTLNSDLRRFERWRNRTYSETLKQSGAFPAAFETLRQVDTRALRGQAPPLELYDLAADPDELVNLAGRPALDEAQRRLERALVEQARRTRDDALGRMEPALGRVTGPPD